MMNKSHELGKCPTCFLQVQSSQLNAIYLSCPWNIHIFQQNYHWKLIILCFSLRFYWIQYCYIFLWRAADRDTFRVNILVRKQRNVFCSLDCLCVVNFHQLFIAFYKSIVSSTCWSCHLWINRYSCPDHINPAEFVADLISVDYSSAESVYSSQKRIDGLVEAFSQQTSLMLYATPITVLDTSKKSVGARKQTVVQRKRNWWKQFWLLLRRAWMQVPPIASRTHQFTQIFSFARFPLLKSQCRQNVIFLRFGKRK